MLALALQMVARTPITLRSKAIRSSFVTELPPADDYTPDYAG